MNPIPTSPPPPPPPATDAEVSQLIDSDRQRLLAKYGGDTAAFRIEAKDWFELNEAIKHSLLMDTVQSMYQD